MINVEKDDHNKKMAEAFPEWPCAKCIGCARHARAYPKACKPWYKWYVQTWRDITGRLRGEK